MGLLIFIGGIVILVLVLNLRSRVQELEKMIKTSERQETPEQNHQTSPQQTEPQSEPPQISHAPPAPEKVGPTVFERFGEWLKEDWLLKLGSMLLLIGFGWFTTYAFLNNWIGPIGRISLGIIAGIAFIVLGWWRIKKYIHQGGIFLVLGSTTILLTVFAAREVYSFFTPLSALIVMFLSTALVALVSVRYNNRALALSSIILAGIAPLLTNAPTSNYVGLYSYLFVVILGAIWIAVLTGRRELTTAAIILVTFYSLPHLLSFTSADKGILLLFIYAFAAVFFLTNTAGILKLRGKEIIPDLVTAVGNGLLLLAWIMFAAQDEWQSLIIAAWMVVFSVGAFLVFRITKRREPFYVYAGVGVAMLAAATSAELNGATLTIAYTIESGIIVLVAYLALRDIKIVEKVSLLLIGPVILSFSSITSRLWSNSIIHKDFFVLLIVGLTLFALGSFFLWHAKEVEDKESQQFNAILLIAGSIYAYALLWLSLHAKFQNDNTAVMIALVVYTVIGLTAYFNGLAEEKKTLRIYGAVLVGLVVGRLFLVDVWSMDMAGRIITFFLIGALLVSTAFLGRKSKKNPPRII